MKKVLVIVVVHNGLRWLERCLSSVEGTDVFAVDNDSTDGSADWIQTHFPKVKLLRSAENLGFSKANNLGFKWAMEKGYDYVYLLNQDAWLEEGALEKLVAAARESPEYAVLSPLQFQDGYQALDCQFAKLYSRTTLPLSRRDKASADARPGRVFADRQIRKGEKAAGVFEGAAPPVLSVKRIMAAHWLVPVSALEEIGPFDETLFGFYGQDDDWCHRVHYHGKKVGVLPEARAVHDRFYREESVEKVIFRNYYTGSLVRLCDINRPLWDRFCYVMLFTLVKAVKYRKMLVFSYFRKICRQLPAVREHRRSVR